MKLSELKKALINASEFENANSLATTIGQTAPFVRAFLESRKQAHGKEDVIFEALTKGVSVDEFMCALKLVTTVRKALIEKEQIL